MSKKPNIRINKVYTKKGDSGETQLIGKEKVSKADIRVANNDIDRIDWYNGTAVISKTDIQAKITEMEKNPKPEWIHPTPDYD